MTDVPENDIDPEALSLARYHAEQAGVAEDIHWQERPFSELRAKAEYGCLITNPPYGERMGEDAEIEQLYKMFPLVLRRKNGRPTARRLKIVSPRLRPILPKNVSRQWATCSRQRAARSPYG